MKVLKLIIPLLAVLFFFSACSGGRMLNDMTIVQAVSLDERGSLVTVGIQYLDLNKGSGTNEGLNSALTATAFGSGKTIENAVDNLAETLPDDYFTGQAKLIVIGSNLSEKRMSEFKEVLKKDKRVRCDILLATAEGSAADVLKNPFRNERVPIDGIYKEIKRKKADVTVNDYLGDNSISLPEIKLGKDYGSVVY